MKTLETTATGLAADLDYYKPTMSQLAYEQAPDAQVTFTYHNRGSQRLMDYVDPDALQEKFDDPDARGWSKPELSYLSGQRLSNGQPVFKPGYLRYLDGASLPRAETRVDTTTNDLAVSATGAWPLATFWETSVMATINETYFENYLAAQGITAATAYREGDRRLSQKIAVLKRNPDIKIADFSTRRRFSLAWERHVLERCLTECPGNIAGTSNVALAAEFGIKPIGTFAHEMPMVYAGLASARGRDIRSSHQQMLQDWYGRYGNDLSIALTDTFTTDFFFRDFSPQQAKQWRGLRHDSGDPFGFGERAIKFYTDNGVDPHEKTIVFSDGLDIGKIVKLARRFKGRINTLYGWGGNLGSDLGYANLNCVMKATHVRLAGSNLEADTVKLSDVSGKHTGPQKEVRRYQKEFGRR